MALSTTAKLIPMMAEHKRPSNLDNKFNSPEGHAENYKSLALLDFAAARAKL